MPAGVFLDAVYVDPWVNWTWLSTHIPLLTDRLQQHLVLTVIAVGGGLALSLPTGIAAHRWPALRNPILTVFGVVYTIPSLALFALLVPFVDAMDLEPRPQIDIFDTRRQVLRK